MILLYLDSVLTDTMLTILQCKCYTLINIYYIKEYLVIVLLANTKVTIQVYTT